MSMQEIAEFRALNEAHRNSAAILGRLSTLNDKYSGSGVCLAVIGSLGRMEVSPDSDFDVYPISKDNCKDAGAPERLWGEALKLSGLKNPSSSGSFGAEKLSTVSDILLNIGGDNDTNAKISQRVLILLESKFVGDLTVRDAVVDQIISRYINENTTNHQLGMFVLNDIIRFYRTMCVDFEYKTTEGGKPWAIRNLKLVFSRKLIYFSGILMCAELAQASAKQKRTIFKDLMQVTPTERVVRVLGKEAERPLAIYDQFMAKMSDADFRKAMEKVSPNARHESDEFTDLKNRGHHFAWALRAAFNRHYDSTHPIHKAIMF